MNRGEHPEREAFGAPGLVLASRYLALLKGFSPKKHVEPANHQESDQTKVKSDQVEDKEGGTEKKCANERKEDEAEEDECVKERKTGEAEGDECVKEKDESKKVCLAKIGLASKAKLAWLRASKAVGLRRLEQISRAEYIDIMKGYISRVRYAPDSLFGMCACSLHVHCMFIRQDSHWLVVTHDFQRYGRSSDTVFAYISLLCSPSPSFVVFRRERRSR